MRKELYEPELNTDTILNSEMGNVPATEHSDQSIDIDARRRVENFLAQRELRRLISDDFDY